MNRAYSVLDVKSFEDGQDYVTIKGIASTPTVDKIGDVVEPMGARFKTPMPLLLQHRHDSPVGEVTFAKPTKAGIPFEARIPKITEPGRVKDRVDEAIHSLKYRLIAAVSIGFSAVADKIERLADGGLRFLEWDWHELSLVTIPANSDAVITAIRSVDQAALASAGIARDQDDDAPERSGHKKRGPVRLHGHLKRKPQFITITPRKKT